MVVMHRRFLGGSELRLVSPARGLLHPRDQAGADNRPVGCHSWLLVASCKRHHRLIVPQPSRRDTFLLQRSNLAYVMLCDYRSPRIPEFARPELVQCRFRQLAETRVVNFPAVKYIADKRC